VTQPADRPAPAIEDNIIKFRCLSQEGAISSVVFVGMMIGSYSWGVLSDQKGRRFGFFATAVLTLFAGLASALSPNYGVLLATRFLVSLSLFLAAANLGPSFLL
jgi:MFS family permease